MWAHRDDFFCSEALRCGDFSFVVSRRDATIFFFSRRVQHFFFYRGVWWILSFVEASGRAGFFFFSVPGEAFGCQGRYFSGMPCVLGAFGVALIAVIAVLSGGKRGEGTGHSK